MRAEGNLALGVNVQIKALLAVRAIAIPNKEIAFRHFAQVVFVQKLALLALLAKGPQPMFTDKIVECR